MDFLKRWVARQFTTRVIVLMPVAIAINIVLGYTTQTVLKLPIYLDSIGTILVGCVAGPLPWRRDRHPEQPDLAIRAGRWPWFADRPVRHHCGRHRSSRGLVGPAWALPAAPRSRPQHRRRSRGGRAHRRPRAVHVWPCLRKPGSVRQRHLQGPERLRPLAFLLPCRHGCVRRPGLLGACTAT